MIYFLCIFKVYVSDFERSDKYINYTMKCFLLLVDIFSKKKNASISNFSIVSSGKVNLGKFEW